MDDRLFVILFFPSFFVSLGIFLACCGLLWWISIQNRELMHRAHDRPVGREVRHDG